MHGHATLIQRWMGADTTSKETPDDHAILRAQVIDQVRAELEVLKASPKRNLIRATPDKDA